MATDTAGSAPASEHCKLYLPPDRTPSCPASTACAGRCANTPVGFHTQYCDGTDTQRALSARSNMTVAHYMERSGPIRRQLLGAATGGQGVSLTPTASN
eukprot:COSAG06_NODE_5403_length_3503_cov_13.804642_4_plen_99_part_00